MKLYVLIGGGVASLAAAEAIRRQDAEGEIVLISADPFGFYSRPGLAYLLTGEVPEKQLYPFSSRELDRLRLRFLRQRVAAVDPRAHVVVTAEGKRIPYDRLLLATGSSAVVPALPGVELEGVVKLDDLQDARRILKLARRARRAVVVGGGITALELVEGLIARGVRVHYLLRGERYWRRVLDETESRIVERKLEEDGVRIHRHAEIAEILGKRGKVAGVRLKSGEVIKCKMVALAVGVRPNRQLAEAAGLRCKRGVLVDEHMRTSAPDIFAAGDVAEVYDALTGRTVLDTLWPTARAQGQIAGLNMAGVPQPYARRVPINVTRLAGITTTIIGTVGQRGEDADILGIVRGDSETWRTLPDAIAAQEGFDVNRLRLMVAENHIVGAIVMGNQLLSQPLYRMIAEKADIGAIRDRLLRPGAPLADILAAFWEEWRVQHGNRALPLQQ
jgi:NAD(P)H-nitrite reductase large subunit